MMAQTAPVPLAPPPARAVFLIGAQKAGSSFLHNLLVANGPFRPARVKEPHYFTSDRRDGAYADMFAPLQEDATLLDSSTSYLHNPDCAQRIAAAFPDAPIVAVLRTPEARIASAYQHLLKHGCETRPLREVLAIDAQGYHDVREAELDRARHAYRRGRITLRRPRPYPRDMADQRHDNPFWNFCYISNSDYDAQLRPFREMFARVLVLALADLAADPIATLVRTLRFLGAPLPDGFAADLDRNASRITRKRALREYLANLRADANAPPAASLRALRGAWPLLGRNIGQDRVGEMADRAWAAPLLASYQNALRPPASPIREGETS